MSGPEVVTAVAECLVAHMTFSSIGGDADDTGLRPLPSDMPYRPSRCERRKCDKYRRGLQTDGGRASEGGEGPGGAVRSGILHAGGGAERKGTGARNRKTR